MQQASKTTRPAPSAVAIWWHRMPEEVRQGGLAIIGGSLALLLFVGQLPWARGSWVATFSLPAQALLGWGTTLALLGAIWSAILTVKGLLQRRVIVRGRWLVGAAVALGLALIESHLLWGPGVGGLIGTAGARLLMSLPPAARQGVILGGWLLDAVIAWHLTWRDLARLVGFARQGAPQPPPILSPAKLPIASPPTMPAPAKLSAPNVSPATASGGTAVAAVPTVAAIPATAAPVGAGDFNAMIELLRVPTYLRHCSAGSFAVTPPPAFALPPLPVKAPIAPAHVRPLGGVAPGAWPLPPLTLCHVPTEGRHANVRSYAERQAATLARTLRGLGVEAEVRPSDISIGPTIIRFGVRPLERPRVDEHGRAVRDAQGDPIVARTRVSRIMNLQHDLALALEVKTLRMEAPVPERPYVGIEIPNVHGRLVTIREVLESAEYHEAAAKSPLAVALGRDVAGRARVGDLGRFPHLLIAGATGAGKSVCLNTIICSLITHASPEQVRLVLIDPKMVEMTPYEGLPHLLAPIVTAPDVAERALEAAIVEMQRRTQLFAQIGVRNLESYDAQRATPEGAGREPLPRIVIIIDELADLMLVAADQVERRICRLAQLARAAGIHLVVATQRPSVDVITGLIKANIPTRVAFMVASAVDSRTILDGGGAEHLLGKGDMLFLANDALKSERIQGAYVADAEIEQLVAFWKRAAQERSRPTQWDLSVPEPATPPFDGDIDDYTDDRLWSRHRPVAGHRRRSR